MLFACDLVGSDCCPGQTAISDSTLSDNDERDGISNLAYRCTRLSCCVTVLPPRDTPKTTITEICPRDGHGLRPSMGRAGLGRVGSNFWQQCRGFR